MRTPDILEVVAGPEAGLMYAMQGDSVRIGRDPAQSDLVLTDPRVSRAHARVWVDGGLLLIDDSGSTAGTVVNGQPIDRPTALRKDDRILLGTTELVVVWVPAPAATMFGVIPPELRELAAEPVSAPPVEPPAAEVPPPPVVVEPPVVAEVPPPPPVDVAEAGSEIPSGDEPPPDIAPAPSDFPHLDIPPPPPVDVSPVVVPPVIVPPADMPPVESAPELAEEEPAPASLDPHIEVPAVPASDPPFALEAEMVPDMADDDQAAAPEEPGPVPSAPAGPITDLAGEVPDEGRTDQGHRTELALDPVLSADQGAGDGDDGATVIATPAYPDLPPHEPAPLPDQVAHGVAPEWTPPPPVNAPPPPPPGYQPPAGPPPPPPSVTPPVGDGASLGGFGAYPPPPAPGGFPPPPDAPGGFPPPDPYGTAHPPPGQAPGPPPDWYAPPAPETPPRKGFFRRRRGG